MCNAITFQMQNWAHKKEKENFKCQEQWKENQRGVTLNRCCDCLGEKEEGGEPSQYP